MNWLIAIDGKKTYILAIITGIFTLIHFMITGDYSLASFIQLSQDTTVIAMVAALRHGISKTGNQGIITTTATTATGSK
jgi:hypothetical protein